MSRAKRAAATRAERALARALREWRRLEDDLTRRGYAYKNPPDFVLREGRWYAPRPLPVWLPRGAPNQCFGNSIVEGVRRGLAYVEGFAMLGHGGALPVVFHHAWGAGPGGELYEWTWPGPGLAYCGVEFSPERADDCTWNGDATVLDDQYRGWPLLREPWRGEPAGLAWPPSPRLQALRAAGPGRQG